MIIYGRDTLHSFSGEFGSVCTRSWLDIPVSASLELTLSPVTCEQGRVRCCERWLYEGLIWIFITLKFGAVWSAGSRDRIFLISGCGVLLPMLI
jgi:hypothetical protein